MTEDEAKTLVCCGPKGTGYENDLPYPARFCRGRACMAWRWTPNVDMRAYTGTAAKARPGYCGLAEAPQ